VADRLAARQAARQVAHGSAPARDRLALERALADGRALTAADSVGAFIQADVAFHLALYRLAGNPAIEETVAPQWPHFKRGMGASLGNIDRHPVVWAEHETITRAVLAGDADAAEEAAHQHALRAGSEIAQRLAAAADAA
jgi:DNA-binding GntR family transcriptional regulator